MAATSTESKYATKQAPAGAGLTPIWIRLPRLVDREAADDEFDGEATARSLSQTRPHETVDRGSAKSGRQNRSSASSAASASTSVASREVADAVDDLPEETPAYLRQLAERKRSGDVEDEEDLAEEAPRKRSQSRKPRRGSESGGFFAQLFKAPYNVLAGIALVAAFVGLYVCFRPATATDESLPEIEPGPSLTLDMGDSSSEPYVSGAEAVDPSTLYPETGPALDQSFPPASEPSSIASANYGSQPSSGFEPVTGPPPVAPGIGHAAAMPPLDGYGTSATTVSTAVGVDPTLQGLPLDTYPETDPATYRYPVDATFDVSPAVERTAEGDSFAPRAASLGDSLEKTPVR